MKKFYLMPDPPEGEDIGRFRENRRAEQGA